MPWDRFESLAKGVLREDGYIAPPYVIDAHTHVHLHIPKPGKTRFKDFNEVSEQLMLKEKAGFIDPKSLIREMDRYGVNKACVLYAGRMCIDFEHYLNILRAEPDRFIGFYWPQEEAVETSPGQWPALTPERMAELAEKALSYPEIRGLGEGTIAEACHFAERKGWPAEDIVRFYMPMLEVVASKKAPIIMHSGPAPYNIKITPSIRKMFFRGYVVMQNFDPMVYDEMITLFPEIPFIIAHCGVQGCHFYGSYADHALILASMHENVYLETSMAPADLIEKAIADPSIGAEKLVLGSDFGATSSYYVYKGQVLPSYKKRPFPELPGMHIEQSIRVLDQVTMCPEERRLIMGQNMARLLGLD